MGIFDSSPHEKASQAHEKKSAWWGSEPTGSVEPPPRKNRGEAEAALPGQEDEATSREPRPRSQTARTAASNKGYMSAKGRQSSRFVNMQEKDVAIEETLKEIETVRRNAARAGAAKTSRKATLRPLVTSRPKPQRWIKRADDWKRERPDQRHLETHHLWGEIPKEMMAEHAERLAASASAPALAGRPPKAVAQVESRVKGGALSEQERAYQLEAQLLKRERKQLAKLKAAAKEDLAVAKHAEDAKRLEWYHTFLTHRLTRRDVWSRPHTSISLMHAALTASPVYRAPCAVRRAAGTTSSASRRRRR